MKTAVSIPDELFHQADELARRQGKSRSAIYREALSEYVRRRDEGGITQAMNDVVASLGGDAGTDNWSKEAARRALERSEWES